MSVVWHHMLLGKMLLKDVKGVNNFCCRMDYGIVLNFFDVDKMTKQIKRDVELITLIMCSVKCIGMF